MEELRLKIRGLMDSACELAKQLDKDFEDSDTPEEELREALEDAMDSADIDYGDEDDSDIDEEEDE